LDEGGRKSGAKGREGIGGGAKAKIRKWEGQGSKAGKI
jgi:hypothetical protein